MRILLSLCFCASAWGQLLMPIVGGGPTCSTPPGTTFTDSFGDGSVSTIGLAGLNQLWSVASGAAHSIAISPGTPTANTACGKSLFMNGAGDIFTYGSFPLIPAATTFDVYSHIYIPSQASSSFWNAFVFQGAAAQLNLQMHSNGTTTTISATGAVNSATVALSLTTWHKIHAHVDAVVANSYLCVDGDDTSVCTGGTVKTFTAAANYFNRVDVVSVAAVPFYLGYLRIDSALGGGPAPSLLMNSSSGTNGATVTTSLLNSSTHCGNATGWTGTVSSETFDTTTSQLLLTPRTVCGVTYPGQAISVKHDLRTTNEGLYAIKTLSPSVSFGLWFKSDLVTSFTNYDIAQIVGSGAPTEGVTVQTVGDGSSIWFQLEVNGSSTVVSGHIAYTANMWFWLTLQYVQGGPHQLSVYDSSGVLVGSATGVSQNSRVPTSFNFLHVGASTSVGAQYYWYSNILVDYQTGAFPVMP